MEHSFQIAMGTLAQFFDPQQPPPPAVTAPQDAGLLQRITKLVEFATRNGPSFVELIKSKQKARGPSQHLQSHLQIITPGRLHGA